MSDKNDGLNNVFESRGDDASNMSDEQLDAYLRRLDSTGSFDDTMITDWLDVPDEFHSFEPDNTQATNVIPKDVKSISEITKRQRLRLEREKNGGKPEPEPVEYEEDSAPDIKLISRRRQPRTGCMGGIMYVAFVIGISIIGACLMWLAINDVLALTKQEASATIEVPDGWTVDSLADELKDKGMIEYKFLFKLYADFTNAEEKIDPGTYVLNTQLDYWAIVSRLRRGAGAALTVEVTIPEGLSLKEIFEALEDKNVCTQDELWEAAADYDFDYSFLDPEDLGNELRLEGYLFPDTYEFFTDSRADNVIRKFLNNFDVRVTSDMIRQAEQMGYTLKEILTIASLIEEEAAHDDERALIASVIYNRLNDDDYPFLDIDASIIYALGEHKTVLTDKDLAVDNPYNTRLNPGLPPGPITNPGLASIEAALNPEESEYYFYALSKDGGHKFSYTYEEHEAFVDSDEYGG